MSADMKLMVAANAARISGFKHYAEALEKLLAQVLAERRGGK